MTASALGDRSVEPDDAQLAEVLGETAAIWSELREFLEAEYGPLVDEWKHYGKRSGWIRKTLRKKRNLFFLTPLDGYFRLGFVLGDKAVAAVEESDLREELKAELRSARKYVEGRGLAVEVRACQDLEPVKTLVAIKLRT